MDEAPPTEPPKRAVISPLRIGLAIVIVLLVIVAGVGYHDGAYWTDPLTSAEAPGLYRFKGVAMEVEAEGFLLDDGGATRRLAWNITRPQAGQWYVVDAEVLENGTLQALALTRVYVFRA